MNLGLSSEVALAASNGPLWCGSTFWPAENPNHLGTPSLTGVRKGSYISTSVDSRSLPRPANVDGACGPGERRETDRPGAWAIVLMTPMGRLLAAGGEKHALRERFEDVLQSTVSCIISKLPPRTSKSLGLVTCAAYSRQGFGAAYFNHAAARVAGASWSGAVVWSGESGREGEKRKGGGKFSGGVDWLRRSWRRGKEKLLFFGIKE
jgi:hypothetical protein